MKKIKITITYDEAKLGAIEKYLNRKNLCLDDEIAKKLDSLYKSVVPSSVKEYIEMCSNDCESKNE